MAGRFNRPPAEVPEPPSMTELMNEALTAPGRLTDTYERFYSYSYGNQLWLMQQGAKEPIASYKGWQKLGRQVVKGARAYYILRPITVKSKTEVDEKGQPLTYTKFKPVKGAFPYSMTEGEDLPEVEPREWNRERALGALGISLVAFDEIDGNKAGFSFDRNVAINPMAKYPLKTLWHEVAHIEAGHTSGQHDEYLQHRGLFEFEAESTAYLGLHEIGEDAHMDASESRAYIQNWLGGETPPDSSIRKVFKLVDLIRRAGYVHDDQGEPVDEDTAAAISVVKHRGLVADGGPA